MYATRLERSNMSFHLMCECVAWPEILYPLKFTHASAQTARSIQGPLLRAMARKAAMAGSRSDDVMHGTLGLQVKHWGDELGMERLKMFLEGMSSHDQKYRDIMKGAMFRGIPSRPSFSLPRLVSMPSLASAFLSSCWRQQQQQSNVHGLTLCML